MNHPHCDCTGHRPYCKRRYRRHAADRIAVIKDGKCAEFGTYEELMKKKGEFTIINNCSPKK